MGFWGMKSRIGGSIRSVQQLKDIHERDSWSNLESIAASPCCNQLIAKGVVPMHRLGYFVEQR